MHLIKTAYLHSVVKLVDSTVLYNVQNELSLYYIYFRVKILCKCLISLRLSSFKKCPENKKNYFYINIFYLKILTFNFVNEGGKRTKHLFYEPILDLLQIIMTFLLLYF